MNWSTYVEKKNAKTYVIPSGWDSREEIANQLECSPEKVDDHLRPGLKSGEIIKQSFKVWDGTLKRCVMVVAYREATKERQAAVTSGDISVATVKKLKSEGKTWGEIGTVLGISREKARNIVRRDK